MPRGGQIRSGRPVFDEATRALHSTKVRARHRTKGYAGEPMITCEPPRQLTPAQREYWDYHAPQWAAKRQLTLEERDALAKYCIGLDITYRLNRKIRSITVKGNKHPLLGELRHWLAITRLYENDLLLNPASAVRAPKPERPIGDAEDQELDDILN